MQEFCFVHVTDTHMEHHPGSSGDDPWRGAGKAIAGAISEARPPVAFVVHTGDLCGGSTIESIGEESSYRRMAAELNGLGVPYYCAVGNHDDPVLLARHLRLGPREPLNGCGEDFAYSFRATGCTGVVLDSRAGTGARGRIADRQIAALERILADSSDRLLLFLHHPVVPLGCEWVDRGLAVENGEVLHRLLARSAGRILGVFFGHIHAHVQTVRDGVLYAGCASVAPGFDVRPGAAYAPIEGRSGAFSLVRVGPGGVSVFPQ